MLKWLDNLLTNCSDSVSQKIINGFILVIKGITYLVVQFDGLFVVIAIVGVFIMMCGNRKLGNKITSLSILIYTIMRVVLSKCS